jgi:ABC-type transport system involved in multi-copper enzyme maturation permease subunit
MSGLLPADRIRLGHRRTLQAIVIAIPLLGATFFLLNFRSTDIQFFFDEATERQSLTDSLTAQGMPPDQIKEQVEQIISDERAGYDQMRLQMEATRATFAFPASVLTLLGSATAVYLFGMILMTATTIGDEFGWGTIRTSLLASSNRRRWLAVRLSVLVSLAVVGLAVLLLLSAILPLAIVAVVGQLPQAPPVDGAALAVLVGGLLVAAIALIGFAAAATVVMRSGSLTLVAALVYVLAETAVVGLLGRLEPFRPANFFGQDLPAGPLVWALNLFPVHAIQVLLASASQLAVKALDYSSEVGSPVLADTYLPLASVGGWAAIFMAIAMVRFNRMDIVE